MAQALDVDTENRAAWITTLPESDRDLAPMLEQLLAKANEAEGMETADVMLRLRSDALREAASAAAATPRIAEQPGAQIGPYRLLQELGSGGMGTVWLAERTDGVIERQVALKLPHAEWTDRGLADRMARERNVLASLNHPNIAQLFDAGWASDGRPYLALEYVEGRAMDTWCRDQTLDIPARLKLFVDVVRAVAFAHAKLVIHRDLKPGNVLVTAEGRVKLLDFGIAKLLIADEALAEETALTRLSGRALTLNYAAPEHVLGQPISTAADTYSLGVMLFELLSGERPYRPSRESRGALEDAIVNVEPPAPSSVATDKATARVLRGDLDTIILKTLRKQPELRYETAAAFADDIERWLNQRPVRAQRASGWYRTRRFLARHRLAVITGTFAASALLVGGSVALWQARAASEEAARADTVKDFVLSIIAQADPVASGETRAADLTLLTTAENRLARELGGRPALALELRVAIANAYRNRGEFERARAALRTAISDAQTLLRSDNPQLLRAWIKIADSQILDEAEVVAGLDDAIAVARRLEAAGVEMLVEGLTVRSALRGAFSGRRAEALADARDAHAIAKKHINPGNPRSLAAARRYVKALAESGAPPAETMSVIEPAYRAAISNSRLGPGHPELIRVLHDYGWALCLDGKGAHCVEVIQDSVRLARLHHGDGLPTEGALGQLQWAVEFTGDNAAAIEVSKQSHAIAAAREPRGSLNRALRADQVLKAMINGKRTSDAQSMLDEIDEYLSAAPPDQIRDGVKQRFALTRGWLMNYSGNTVEAEAILRQSYQSYAIETDVHYAAFMLAGWSLALRHNGKPEEAERVLRAHYGDAPVPPGPIGALELAAVRLARNAPTDSLDIADELIRRRSRVKLRMDRLGADLFLIRGQSLLRLDRASEANEALQRSHQFWQEYDAQSHWAAEAAYWYGQALIATGDTVRGQQWVRQMRPRLAKSPMPLHRALATSAAASR